jgi:hypothetical protein
MGTTAHLDLASVLKASQAVSNQVTLEMLLILGISSWPLLSLS